ncbi:hypothetical protein EDB83DRAFT_2233572, partial [Lactarius deliciosus]
MSRVLTATSPTSFATIFTAALNAYKQQTKRDLTSHPLSTRLQSCDSSSAILDMLRTQFRTFDRSQAANERWSKWLDPTVNVLYAFSVTLGSSVGLIFPPSNAIFAGIGVLLQAIKDVRTSQDALVDIFGRLEYFFKRLEQYIEVRPTAAMTDIIVKIMVEVLSILGIVTKEVGQGRTKAYLKKLVGRKDVEDALQRLDALTQEEARMAAAEVLVITRGIDDKVKDVGEKVKDVGDKVKGVDDKVKEVDEKVEAVDEKVEAVDERVKAVDIKVDGIDNEIRTVDSRVRSVDHKVGSVVQGQFRWVFCQLEVLRHCFPTNLRRILEELPKSLDETYKRILKEINNANREHAYRLLQCLAVASRPLRVEELAEVLAFDLSTGRIPKLIADWRWEDQEEAVLSACSSLVSVTVDNGSRVVQFSHFSVKEFLISDRLASCTEEVSRFYIPFEPSHMIIAQACLGVLLRLDDDTDKDSAEKIPLVQYAAEYWDGH